MRTRSWVQCPSGEVQQWLDRLPDDQEPVVAALRALIGSVAPDAHEIVHHDALGYGPASSGFDRVLYVARFRHHVNLGLFYGASLPDPEGLLGGSGKRMRHAKIGLVGDVQRVARAGLLRDAWTEGVREALGRHRRAATPGE
jgi:hypothetical protein